MLDKMQLHQGWKQLSPHERMLVTLVSERSKRGARISWRPHSLSMIEAGDYRTILRGPSDIDITSPEHALVYLNHSQDLILRAERAQHRNSKRQQKEIFAEHMRIDGWLYSFPECCVERRIYDIEHGKGRYSEAESRAKDDAMTLNFGEQLVYLPDHFTPCKPDCSEVAKMLNKYERTINRAYPSYRAELAARERRARH